MGWLLLDLLLRAAAADHVEDRDRAANSPEALPVRIVLRPIGTSLPLGFLALVVGTTAFAAAQLGWLSAEQGRVAASAALLFTVPPQLVACLFGFLARDPVAGTGTGALTGTGAVVGASTLSAPPGASSPGLDAVLLVAALCLLVPAAAARGELVAVAVRGAPVEEVSAVEHEAGAREQP